MRALSVVIIAQRVVGDRSDFLNWSMTRRKNDSPSRRRVAGTKMEWSWGMLSRENVSALLRFWSAPLEEDSIEEKVSTSVSINFSACGLALSLSSSRTLVMRDLRAVSPVHARICRGVAFDPPEHKNSKLPRHTFVPHKIARLDTLGLSSEMSLHKGSMHWAIYSGKALQTVSMHPTKNLRITADLSSSNSSK